jgi:hypothetical protein
MLVAGPGLARVPQLTPSGCARNDAVCQSQRDLHLPDLRERSFGALDRDMPTDPRIAGRVARRRAPRRMPTAVVPYRGEDLLLILDRKLRPSAPGRFATRVVTRGVNPQLYCTYKSSRLKQYFKLGRALRTETVIGDTRTLGSVVASAH